MTPYKSSNNLLHKSTAVFIFKCSSEFSIPFKIEFVLESKNIQGRKGFKKMKILVDFQVVSRITQGGRRQKIGKLELMSHMDDPKVSPAAAAQFGPRVPRIGRVYVQLFFSSFR